MTAQQIKDAAAKQQGLRFRPNLDGCFLSRTLKEIYAAGEQAKVPLLAGSNTEDQAARGDLGGAEPTPENFAAAVKKLYGDHAGEILKVYPASTS